MSFLLQSIHSFSEQKRQTDEILEQIKTETLDSKEEATLWEQVDAELQDLYRFCCVKFVNQIITNGIDNKVSIFILNRD